MVNLDSDIILLQLWKGERKPQNEEETKWKQELDTMKQRGEVPDLSWFDLILFIWQWRKRRNT